MKNYNIVDDLNFISDSCLPELKIIANKSILITGGTGFFGKWFIESIALANINFSLNISLTIITRNKSSFLLTNPNLPNIVFYNYYFNNFLFNAVPQIEHSFPP